MMSCADLARIINSDQVQAKLRDVRINPLQKRTTKKNPLKNHTAMLKLNPFWKRKQEIHKKAAEAAHKLKLEKLKKKHSKAGRKEKVQRRQKFNDIQKGLVQSFKAAEDVLQKEKEEGLFEPEDLAGICN